MPPSAALGETARKSTMSVQCVSCRREFFTGPDKRPLPWCPSCGGNLKPQVEPVPALAAANPSAPSPAAGHEPEPVPVAASALPVQEPVSRPNAPVPRLDELGTPERVFRASIWRRLVCWISALVCFGLAAAIGYGVLHQPHKNPQSGLMLMGLMALGGIASFYFALTLGELSYLVFHDALVRRRGGESTVVPWDRIWAVYVTIHPAWKKYQVVIGKGKDFELSGDTANYRALGDLIEQKLLASRLPQALADLEAGKTVGFGPLTVHRAGLGFDCHSCPWSQVSLNVGLNPEPVIGTTYSNLVHLHVHSPVLTKAYKVEIGDIPNFPLFLALVRNSWPECLSPGM
jgi:hypothetical protein